MQTTMRKAHLFVLLVGAATPSLVACGVYEWPARDIKVAPRSFIVREDALLAVDANADAGAAGGACASPAISLKLADSCKEDTCGTIVIRRDDKPFASLLTPETRRPSTVDPKRVERPYATPAPVDGSRRAIGLPAGEATYIVEAKCDLAISKADPSVVASGKRLTLSTASITQCSTTVEVSCK